jgi:hypothetical protein
MPQPDVPGDRGLYELGPRPCLTCGQPGQVVQQPDGRTFVHDATGERCPAIEPRPLDGPNTTIVDPRRGQGWWWDCKHCGAKAGYFATEQESAQHGAQHTCPQRAAFDARQQAITDQYANQQGDTMTQTVPTQSGEVTGLMSAINYADAVAAAHDAHSAGGGEQYRASLGQAQVGPETIASAARAQEATEIAAAAWREHGAKLREQLAAKEATTAETGTKDFLLAE